MRARVSLPLEACRCAALSSCQANTIRSTCWQAVWFQTSVCDRNHPKTWKNHAYEQSIRSDKIDFKRDLLVHIADDQQRTLDKT